MTEDTLVNAIAAFEIRMPAIFEFFPSDDNIDASNIIVDSIRQWFMHLENAPMGASVTWSSVWNGGEAELVLVEDGGIYATVFHGGGGVSGTLTVTANHEGTDYIATVELSGG